MVATDRAPVAIYPARRVLAGGVISRRERIVRGPTAAAARRQGSYSTQPSGHVVAHSGHCIGCHNSFATGCLHCGESPGSAADQSAEECAPVRLPERLHIALLEGQPQWPCGVGLPAAECSLAVLCMPNGRDQGCQRLAPAGARQSCDPAGPRVQNGVGPDAIDPRDTAEILAGAANPYHAALSRTVSAARLAPTSAKLPRNSNQIASGRICQLEFYMPSHVVGSLRAYLAMGAELERGRFRSSVQSARRSYLLARRSISSRAN